MKVTIWGTRGSFPTTNQDMSRYGGNTTCIEVNTNAGDIIILDAGTGIRDLGNHLLKTKGTKKCSICFTHQHWDHINGINSFTPMYTPDWNVCIFGAKSPSSGWRQTLETVFSTSHFPIEWDQIRQKNSIEEFNAGDSFTIGSALIETCTTNHPGLCTAYKITADGWTFLFSGDHEWAEESSIEQNNMQAFMHGANVVLADAYFHRDDYSQHIGWGHSTMEQWISHALEAKVNRVIFTHHHPDCTDIMLDHRLDLIWREQPDLPMELLLAYEGMCIYEKDETTDYELDSDQSACHICGFSHKMSRYADAGVILESILTEARLIGKADAGTIYLIKDYDLLTFAHTQNDTLFPNSEATKMIYLDATIPINETSITGYVAISALTLNIANVQCIPKNVPYSFDSSFDKRAGYTTISMLSVPLIDSTSNKVIGVIQLINSTQNGIVHAFTMATQNKLEQLAVLATHYIERSQLTNQLILRMFDTAALHDPTETAGHVLRVGSIAAEIYHRWAEKHNITYDELRTTKDTIRLAAMLHDVGKVGVPDAVLKKPGRLNPEEFEVIKQHTIWGASLFKSLTSRLDEMAYNIALHHHQKWNGQGYGDPNSECLSGQDIPLEARITSVADVYDALISKRCYKEAMSTGEAINILQKEAGICFDPEIVGIFTEIVPVIEGIIKRFED